MSDPVDNTEKELQEEFEKLGMKEDASDSEADNDTRLVGGYRNYSKEDIKEQRKAMMDFIKSVGANVFRGSDLLNVSLPVTLFTPRSFLERITDNWTGLISFLPLAAKAVDPVERMKYVVAFIVSGFHTTVETKKPFNPIWGETYEGVYEDGTRVFCEQTSHHPPVSHWEVHGKDDEYVFSGHGHWSGALRGNSLKGQQHGPCRIVFKDGSVLEWRLPYLHLRGLLWGERVMEYGGLMTVTDEKNKIGCDLQFDPERVSWLKSFFVSRKSPSDLIRGSIYAKNGDIKFPYVEVEGSWLSFLDYLEKSSGKRTRYWDIKSAAPKWPGPAEDPLPSDCRYREDLKYLKENNIEEAQKWKVLLEEKQRYERKLRKDAKK